MFYSADNLRTSAQITASHITLQKCSQEGKGGARKYRRLCKNAKESARQKITGKENQTSPVNEFGAFLCRGRYKSLGSLKSFL